MSNHDHLEDISPPRKKVKKTLVVDKPNHERRLCYDELLGIIGFLTIRDVISCMLVNSNWKITCKSNLIWKPFFDYYFMNEFFKWDEQITPLEEEEDDEEYYQVDDDDDDEDEAIMRQTKEKANIYVATKEVFPLPMTNQIVIDGHINYYNLFISECWYPQIHRSHVDLLSQLRNVDSITDTEVLRSLIKHIWTDNTDSYRWNKIIGSAEMILDGRSKLWKRKIKVVYLGMILLVLFNKEGIDYVNGHVIISSHRRICTEMPLLAFCKMISSNRSHLSHFCSTNDIKKTLIGASLKIGDTLCKTITPDCYLSKLQDLLRIVGINQFEAKQHASDFLSPDTDEFASNFFNAGSMLQCYQSIKAKIEDNIIKFDIVATAKYC